MRLARMLIPAALTFAAPLAAQTSPAADLKVATTPFAVTFEVLAPADPFLGVVLVGLDPVQICCLAGMPPLLAGSVALGWGVGSEGSYVLSVPYSQIPAGVKFHLQGVAVTDAVYTSAVVGFWLDVSEAG